MISLQDAIEWPHVLGSCASQGVRHLDLSNTPNSCTHEALQALLSSPSSELSSLTVGGVALSASILRLLRSSPRTPLSCLSLINCSLSGDHASLLSPLSSSLHRLHLDNNPSLAGWPLQLFAKESAPLTLSLTLLSLSGIPLSAADLRCIFSLLQSSAPALEALMLARCNLRHKTQIDPLIRFLGAPSCPIVEMDLSQNPLRPIPNFYDLLSLIGSSRSPLQRLSLCDTGLGKQDVDLICELIESDSPLEHLDLSQGAFGSAITRLGVSLARNYTLKSLRLADCGIRVAQAEQMYASMQSQLPSSSAASSSSSTSSSATSNASENQAGTSGINGGTSSELSSTNQRISPSYAINTIRIIGLPPTCLPPGLPIHTLLLSPTTNMHIPDANRLRSYTAVVVADCDTFGLDAPALQQVQFLESIYMQRCSIGKKPSVFNSLLTHLRSLSLHNCGIRDMSSITEAHAFVPNLEILSLHRNRIRAIPSTISNLANLKFLGLRNNELTEIPSQLALLNRLECIELMGNPLSSLPPLVAEHQLQGDLLVQLLEYLRGMSHRGGIHSPFLNVYMFSRGVVDAERVIRDIGATLGGVSPSGSLSKKSSLSVFGFLKRATGTRSTSRVGSTTSLGNVFNTSSASPPSAVTPPMQRPSSVQSSSGRSTSPRGGTVSAPLSRESLSGSLTSIPQLNSVSLSSFPFPAQVIAEEGPVDIRCWSAESMADLEQLASVGMHGVYMWIFDGTRFEKDPQGVRKDIMEWYKMATMVCDRKRSLFYIVALGTDEAHSAPMRDLEAELRPSMPSPLPQFRVLTKGGSLMFLKGLYSHAVKRSLVAGMVPSVWVSVAESIAQGASDELNVTTLASFEASAQGFGLSPAEIPNLLRYMHDTGFIWWFDKPFLRDFVFHNPPTLISVTRKLVGRLATESLEGILGGSYQSIWANEVPPQFQSALFSLLHELGLLFDANGRTLVPAALSSRAPLINPTVQDEVARLYIFKYIPRRFFAHFVAKISWFPGVTISHLWQSGVSLTVRSEDDSVESGRLLWDPLLFTLELIVVDSRKGGNAFSNVRARLFRFLIETAESLARGVYRAKFRVKIPCNHCLADPTTRGAPFHFAYQQVVDALTSNVRTLLCQGLKSRQVLISSLCPDLALADLSRHQIHAASVELLEELGKGGFATVFKGIWRGREVAVKQMHACETDEDFAEFHREAWIMSGLKSPYLVSLLGVCLEPPMLVMEFLPFGSLYSFLQKRKGQPLDPAFRRRIALDVALGMSVLESSAPPLIHRDLKSPNVLLASDSPDAAVCAKVTDFGLSKQYFGQFAGRDVFNPDWLAPEIILEQPYTMAADVFSFGVILWELTTLQHPYDEFSNRFLGLPDSVKEAAIAKEGLRPTIPVDACESWWATLIESCWQADPNARPTFDVIVKLLSSKDGERGRMSVKLRDDAMNDLLQMLTKTPSQDLEVKRNRVKIVKRVLQKAPPVGITISSEDLIWACLRDGSISCSSGRVGSVLNHTMLRPDSTCTCVTLVQGNKLWVGFRDGAISVVTTSAVVIDTLEQRKGSCVAIASVPTVSVTSVAVFSDGLFVAYGGMGGVQVIGTLQLRNGCRGVAIHKMEGTNDVMAFVGDSSGTVTVIALPLLSIRGSFLSSPDAVSCLTVVDDVLWVGNDRGLLSMFRISNNISTLAPRNAHQSAIVSIVSFAARLKRVCTVSQDGHLCWWNMNDLDLEWEAVRTFEAQGSEVVSFAACGSSSATLIVCELAKNSLTFVKMIDDPQDQNKAEDIQGSPNDSRRGMEKLLRNADQDVKLYVSLQQFRQCLPSDAERRLGIARSIYADFFQKSSPDVAGIPQNVYAAVRAKLQVVLKNAETIGCPPDLFDSLASFIFARKRHSSFLDLTKTVFLDLCAKGIELRALTYDEGLVATFISMCEDFSPANWDQFTCSSKLSDGRKAKVAAWQYRMDETHMWTGKSRIDVNVPPHIVLGVVSRPEHKLRWESQLLESRIVKNFSPDFYVVHSVFSAPSLVMDRDAVVAYLCLRRQNTWICVARSVPYGDVPVAKDLMRIEVGISGYLIRPDGNGGSSLIMLNNLRELRRANAVALRIASKKRFGSLLKLKHYCESMDDELRSSIVDSTSPASTSAPPPLMDAPMGTPVLQRPGLRVELGKARTKKLLESKDRQSSSNMLASSSTSEMEVYEKLIKEGERVTRDKVEGLLQGTKVSLEGLLERAAQDNRLKLVYLLEEMVLEKKLLEESKP